MSDAAPEAAQSNSAGLFSWRAAIILVLVGVASFASLVVLNAFAPEFEDRDQAGLHAYSKSALGYNAAVELLRRLDRDVEISREPWRLDDYGWDGTLVLTPANGRDADELAEVNFDRDNPVLIILPKRYGWRDRQNPRHQQRVFEQNIAEPRSLVNELSDTLGVRRTSPPSSASWFGSTRDIEIDDIVQVISSGNIEPILTIEEGTLFGRLQGTDTYILSDPELANTHGLSHIENVKLWIDIIDEVTGEGDVKLIFDTTLHGFETSRSLLRLLFEPPFLGATLAAFVTALLLGWAAFVRFGTPPELAPPVATGRKSLIESTTGLFDATSREATLSSEYSDLSERMLLEELGYPPDLPKDVRDATLAKAIKKSRNTENREHLPDPDHVTNRVSLMAFARAYHDLKEDLSDGRE